MICKVSAIQLNDAFSVQVWRIYINRIAILLADKDNEYQCNDSSFYHSGVLWIIICNWQNKNVRRTFMYVYKTNDYYCKLITALMIYHMCGNPSMQLILSNFLCSMHNQNVRRKYIMMTTATNHYLPVCKR